MARTIRQTALIKGATAKDLYATIMEPARHGALFGQEVKISDREGAAFSVGRDLEGKNLRLVKDKKIVQQWRANNWPAGVYSTATFAFAKAPGGAKVTFTQTGVPSPFYKEIADGWRAYYWGPMRKAFAKAR